MTAALYKRLATIQCTMHTVRLCQILQPTKSYSWATRRLLQILRSFVGLSVVHSTSLAAVTSSSWTEKLNVHWPIEAYPSCWRAGSVILLSLRSLGIALLDLLLSLTDEKAWKTPWNLPCGCMLCCIYRCQPSRIWRLCPLSHPDSAIYLKVAAQLG